jgi:hypothetical protein
MTLLGFFIVVFALFLYPVTFLCGMAFESEADRTIVSALIFGTIALILALALTGLRALVS